MLFEVDIQSSIDLYTHTAFFISHRKYGSLLIIGLSYSFPMSAALSATPRICFFGFENPKQIRGALIR